jgi:hypothetical protein
MSLGLRCVVKAIRSGLVRRGLRRGCEGLFRMLEVSRKVPPTLPRIVTTNRREKGEVGRVRRAYGVLMGIYVYAETVLLAFTEDTNEIVHILIIILLPATILSSRHCGEKKETYGPVCSRASQVTGNLSRLNPHPLRRARCS